MYTHDTRAAGTRQFLVPAALLTSGLIHLILTPEHLVEAPILGLGFATVAGLQLAFGLLMLLRPSQHLGVGALVLAVFSLGVYLIVRLAGLPLGHGHQDGPPLIELLCKGAEVLAIGGLVLSSDLVPPPVFGARIRVQRGRSAYLMALVAAGLLTAIVASYVGGALMPPHGHNQPHAHPADPHEHAVVGSIRTASAPLLTSVADSLAG